MSEMTQQSPPYRWRCDTCGTAHETSPATSKKALNECLRAVVVQYRKELTALTKRINELELAAGPIGPAVSKAHARIDELEQAARAASERALRTNPLAVPTAADAKSPTSLVKGAHERIDALWEDVSRWAARIVRLEAAATLPTAQDRINAAALKVPTEADVERLAFEDCHRIILSGGPKDGWSFLAGGYKHADGTWSKTVDDFGTIYESQFASKCDSAGNLCRIYKIKRHPFFDRLKPGVRVRSKRNSLEYVVVHKDKAMGSPEYWVGERHVPLVDPNEWEIVGP